MNEEELETDDTDELFDWMANVFATPKSDLSDYTCTLSDGKIESVSDGQQTIQL